MCIERARLLIKRGNGKPTIPTSNDHTDGTWLVTDIYVGEQYMDLDTGVIYTRDANDDINQVSNGGLIGSYRANIAQTGTDAPVVNWENNNLGDTPVWSRFGEGIYRLTLAGAFEGNVYVTVTNGEVTNRDWQILARRSNDDVIAISTFDLSTGNFIDGRLLDTTVIIEVYAPQTIS
jgi:hypothetical protein